MSYNHEIHDYYAALTRDSMASVAHDRKRDNAIATLGEALAQSEREVERLRVDLDDARSKLRVGFDELTARAQRAESLARSKDAELAQYREKSRRAHRIIRTLLDELAPYAGYAPTTRAKQAEIDAVSAAEAVLADE